MDIKDFLKEIKQSENLEILDNKPIKKEKCYKCELEILVFNHKSKKKYKVKKDAIEKLDWDNIKAVLSGREPIILDGITRIVGYFSKISNWNESKIGELKDRRKGIYRIDV